MSKPSSGRGLFLTEFVRSPLSTASVLPSSPHLSAPMVAPIDARAEPTVVELGPGTGAFTAAIQQRLAGRGRHVAVELNERPADHLSERFRNLSVGTDTAERLPEVLARHGCDSADVVVSGLPWSAFAGGDLIDTIAASLTPEGVYTQFGYTWTRWAPPARRQRSQLRAAFQQVSVSPTVWRNLPPAAVSVARRPRAATHEPIGGLPGR